MPARRIRLGIIGTGIAARELHWPPLSAMPDLFEIVALCNHNPDKAREFARHIGLDPKITADVADLLRLPEVDAVDLTLPISLNEQVTCDALQAGKHVIVEKPIAGTAAGGKHVVREANAHPGLVLLVAENIRYQPRFRLARRLLDEGRIGKPVLVHADILQPLNPDSPYVHTEWRRTPHHIGGFLSDGGVHQTAGMQMLGGPVEAVQGVSTSFSDDSDVPDTLMMNLVFSSGAIGHLTYSVGVFAEEEASFRVFGTAGTLAVHRDRVSIQNADGSEDLPVDGNVSGIELEFRDFYRAITESVQPEVSPQDGLNDLLVIDAALRSHREGKLIHVHADPGGA